MIVNLGISIQISTPRFMSTTVLMMMSDMIVALLGAANFFVSRHFPIKDLALFVAISSKLALSASLQRWRGGRWRWWRFGAQGAHWQTVWLSCSRCHLLAAYFNSNEALKKVVKRRIDVLSANGLVGHRDSILFELS
jgi:hypothetical protein